MKKLKKQNLIIICLIFCGLAFIIPFLLRTYDNSLFTILSLSFTAVGAIATVSTMIIAISLYDRFGLETKFIEKQTDKVLELADLLKGKKITVEVNGLHYIVRPNRQLLKGLTTFSEYKLDCKKIMIISLDDYDKSFNEIEAIKRSYWLPNEIKEKMKFIQILAVGKVANPLDENFAKFNFHSASDKNWVLPLPQQTFEDFNNSLHNLVEQIELWLNCHSEISLDLKFEEQNQFINNQTNEEK